MGNPVKGETPLELSDGRTFTLVAGFRAFVVAEKSYGAPIEKVQADAMAGYLGAAITLFHAMLAVKHPDITIDEAGEMIFSEQEAVMIAVGEAVKAANPESGGRKSGNVGKAGRVSGRSGAKRASTRKDSGNKPRARSA